jgi:hypothetical protein
MAEAIQAVAFMAAGSTVAAAVFMVVADAAKPTKLSGRFALFGKAFRNRMHRVSQGKLIPTSYKLM